MNLLSTKCICIKFCMINMSINKSDLLCANCIGTVVGINFLFHYPMQRVNIQEELVAILKEVDMAATLKVDTVATPKVADFHRNSRKEDTPRNNRKEATRAVMVDTHHLV